MMSCRVVAARIVASAALLLVVACSDTPQPMEPFERADVVLPGQLPDDPPSDAALMQAIPGFGGLFLDDEDVPTVYLTNPEQRRNAESALSGFLAARGFTPSQLRVLRGDYDYAQLQAWFDRATQHVFEMGAVFIDLDEAANRVRVGFEAVATAASARTQIVQLGIPAGALIVEQTEPIVQALTLRDRVRPVQGALQIHFGGFLCTLGFNAIRSGVNSFITNSHCTNVQGGVESTLYYQPLQSVDPRSIGTEVSDPGYFIGGPCPFGRRCRYSDSSRARFASGIPFALGRIARPNLNSITINRRNPFWTIIGEQANPMVGERLNKAGRTTGRTRGRVIATCVNTGVSGTNIVQLCQSFVQAGVGPGDSGSPVMKLHGGGNARLMGILWGGNASGSMFVFSPMSGIERELGALTTS